MIWRMNWLFDLVPRKMENVSLPASGSDEGFLGRTIYSCEEEHKELITFSN